MYTQERKNDWPSFVFHVVWDLLRRSSFWMHVDRFTSPLYPPLATFSSILIIVSTQRKGCCMQVNPAYACTKWIYESILAIPEAAPKLESKRKQDVAFE